MPEWRHQVIGFGSGEGLEVQATVTAPARNLDGLIQRLARLIAPKLLHHQASDEIQWRATADEDGHYSLAIPL